MEQPVETSIFENEINLTAAGHGLRFANLLIDLLSFYAIVFCVIVVLTVISPETTQSILAPLENKYVERFFTLLLFGIYIGVVEAIFGGRTLGKLITGTKAVNLDGTSITVPKAFLRGIIRAVPFNPMSALGGHGCNPWHDRWTDTEVIILKKSILPMGA